MREIAEQCGCNFSRAIKLKFGGPKNFVDAALRPLSRDR